MSLFIVAKEIRDSCMWLCKKFKTTLCLNIEDFTSKYLQSLKYESVQYAWHTFFTFSFVNAINANRFSGNGLTSDSVS